MLTYHELLLTDRLSYTTAPPWRNDFGHQPPKRLKSSEEHKNTLQIIRNTSPLTYFGHDIGHGIVVEELRICGWICPRLTQSFLQAFLAQELIWVSIRYRHYGLNDNEQPYHEPPRTFLTSSRFNPKSSLGSAAQTSPINVPIPCMLPKLEHQKCLTDAQHQVKQRRRILPCAHNLDFSNRP